MSRETEQRLRRVMDEVQRMQTDPRVSFDTWIHLNHARDAMGRALQLLHRQRRFLEDWRAQP
jgi:hypothetical protein